ncbi:putative signal transduction protein with CBS domains [Streptococcus varani]|uniref:Putative signal transduction protein with CBS domains n=1 Tax=Streptococcus varani TaxID=1608583 RepID=A0A0E3WF27_9STRE|nr:CBS domain-containing protein [Streptococcus varani]CQR24751.1 putative signal transduction protein with CBS domains [Streptococcus varani]
MAVRDFMTRKVIYISPETTIAHAADLMRAQDIHRLPVIENDQLVGLVTEGTIAEASPSKATSLSIYEMNYLLNKTKVKDVMIKDVITVSQFASLEDAVYLMFKHKVGILPVMDSGGMSGVITDRDVFKAFLHISGYGEDGVRIRCQVKDEAGRLSKILAIISEQGYNIAHTVQIETSPGMVIIEIQIEGQVDKDLLHEKLEEAEVEVESILPTVAKRI